MSIGFFQGELDANTSAADARVLEQKAKAAGKTNLEFTAMFAFLRRHRK